MKLRSKSLALLVFGLTLHQSAFAEPPDAFEFISHVSIVVSILLGLAMGFLLGLVRLNKSWLIPIVGYATVVIALVLAIIMIASTRDGSDRSIVAFLLRFVSFFLSSIVIFVLVRDVGDIFRSNGQPWLALLKSPSRVFAMVVICCFAHAFVDRVPTHYCRSAKKEFTEKEICSHVLEAAVRGGGLLLGPGELSGADYYEKNPSSCRVGYGSLFRSTDRWSDTWRLGGLYEYFFVDEALWVETSFNPTALAMSERGMTEFKQIGTYREMDSCLRLTYSMNPP
jgi:hypothetical protein